MEENKKVKLGFIGLGGRGQSLLTLLVQEIENVEIVAVCDEIEERMKKGGEIVRKYSNTNAKEYKYYKDLLKHDEIEAVIVATTWITHSFIAIDCMEAGKNVGVEVGGAASIDECWQLVHTSEKTGKFCMLLENCCYGQDELTVFNMQRMGLFGEIIHAQGGYQHDLRDEIALGRENQHGRFVNFLNRNGDVYPTHQFGPIAKLLKINRGNRILSLTSMSSKSRGLNEWIKTSDQANKDLLNVNFEQGDIVTTMLKCAHGETIFLIHDCTLPRPYSRNGRIQGTKGIWSEEKNSIYIENLTLDENEKFIPHKWQNFDLYKEKYLHPLWKEYIENGVKSGHDGIDYLSLSAFINSVKTNTKPPIDVYDMAVYKAITCLSEQSVVMGSMPVAMPDFTNGKWINREPFVRSKYCLEEVCEECFYGLSNASFFPV